MSMTTAQEIATFGELPVPSNFYFPVGHPMAHKQMLKKWPDRPPEYTPEPSEVLRPCYVIADDPCSAEYTAGDKMLIRPTSINSTSLN